jgi:hypothetical protein
MNVELLSCSTECVMCFANGGEGVVLLTIRSLGRSAIRLAGKGGPNALLRSFARKLSTLIGQLLPDE